MSNVRYAFDYARQIEPFCYGTKETSRIGAVITFDPEVDEGVARILLEEHLDFDIVLPGDCLDDFDVIIFPENGYIKKEEESSYLRFLKRGGKLLLFGDGGRLESTGQYLPGIPLTYRGKSTDQFDYVRFPEGREEGMNSPFLCYSSAHIVDMQGGRAEAAVRRPYFNRTVKQFCSHMTVPYQPEDADYPAMVSGNGFVYVAHELFRMYFRHGAQLHREVFRYAFRKLQVKPVLEVGLMSAGRVRLAWQEAENRYVLHLLYGSPILRGAYQVLEDFPVIRDTRVRIRTERKITRVLLQPQREPLEFRTDEEGLSFLIPEFRMHQIVTLETEKT